MCVSVYIHIYKPDSGNHSCAQFIWAIRLQIQPRLDLQKKTPPPILIVGDRTSGVQSKLWLHSAESDRWQPDLTTSGWIWLPGAGMVTIIKKKRLFCWQLFRAPMVRSEQIRAGSWGAGQKVNDQKASSLFFVFYYWQPKQPLGAGSNHIWPDPDLAGRSPAHTPPNLFVSRFDLGRLFNRQSKSKWAQKR